MKRILIPLLPLRTTTGYSRVSSSSSSSPSRRSASPSNQGAHPSRFSSSFLETLLPLPRRRQLLLSFFTFLFLSILLFILHGFHSRVTEHAWAQQDRLGKCEFVSPVEAYWETIHRVRKQNGLSAESVGGNGGSGKAGMRFERSGEVEFEVRGEGGGGGEEHPIPWLLRQAERKWQALVGRESTSLEEAVAEYEARWNRRPPKGFDHWFAFTRKHKVLLPSTYHPLLQSTLTPYHALPPTELVRRAKIVEDYQETFVLDIQAKVKGGTGKGAKGNVTLELKPGWEDKWPGTKSRAVDQVKLIKPFLSHLPDLRVTFSLHDGPSIFPLKERMTELKGLAERGEVDEKASEERDVNEVDWEAVCGKGGEKTSRQTSKSFIFDRVRAEDVCLNPAILSLQGIYLEPHTRDSHPRPHSMLLPMLSFAKTTANGDILAAPLDQFAHGRGKDPVWAKKSDERMVWRGATTGIYHNSLHPWRSSHRSRLALLTNSHSHLNTSSSSSSSPPIDVDVVVISPHIDPVSGRTTMKRNVVSSSGGTKGGEKKDRESWNRWFFDVKFTGRAIQCEGGEGDVFGKGAGGTCREMMEELPFAKHQGADEMNKYKYLVDVDGNSWSARFRRLLSTNSLVLKATTYPEWYSDALIPWFHYVPLKVDYSDMFDTLAFFRGTPEQPGGFDEVAKALARNGQCFVRRLWRKEDLQAYMFLVYLELARLLSLDRASMDLAPF
ncbi:glycosyl transferase family 90-domain-containing protein [Mrakia frigida]|uniref:glycosyl transferase family 90-domain-containing protein n=1 Tax=Mrakia frigida TaxID=29902 RepID=UPI003FCBF2B2